MDSEDPKLLPALERLAELAQQKGASDVELLDLRWQASSVEVRDGRAGPTQHTRGTILRGRVYAGEGQVAGFATKDPARATEALSDALLRARSMAPAPAAAPAERFPISERGQGLDDRRYGQISDRERAEVALENFSGCDLKGVHCLGADYNDNRNLRAFFSTRGIATTNSDTRYDVRVRASLADGSHETSFQAAGRAFASIGVLPYGRDLAERLKELAATPVPFPGGDPAIVLEPEVLSTLVHQLGPAFCADRVQAGASFLSGHDGPLGSDRVSLIDDGSLHGALLARAFDDRGVPPMPVPLIRDGALGGLLHSPETAREGQARPTGHVLDGNLSPSNLLLRPGRRSRTQMLGEVPLALQFDRLDGELDLRTGRFEYRGPAWILEAGKRRGRVAQAVLRGHITELLAGVKELANNQRRTLDVDCATAVITDFPVSAE
ncbi:MAG: metallopeptidase TldD-related protein [Myxococcota bacterium]|nr:metallopeptidase TldD-related protein [Myxococcota bacterium]